ncbi:MAG: radical SAM protein [Bacillota bacterium]|nr:radical SAM protein [Bacillota bacterium]
MFKRSLYGSIIITYRCNARCNMCDCYKDPSKPSDEIGLDVIRKLPQMAFTNITGGEPFTRLDISDIVEELYKKTNRIVISTNGSYPERIIELCKKYPNIGIRISIEGLQETNDKIRGLKDGFKNGYETLTRLVEMKHKDVGFGMTVQDMNCKDLLELYKIADDYNMEFATATLHNSFYFRKTDNKIEDKLMVSREFEKLINELLKSKSPKKWFRAYFNHGLINYIYDHPRLLPCGMASNGFFVDPFGNVLPCNGSKEPLSMGNLNNQSFEEIWNSEKAQEVRNKVNNCEKNCWMIGSAAPAMKQKIWKPAAWVIKHKIKGKYSISDSNFIEDV